MPPLGGCEASRTDLALSGSELIILQMEETATCPNCATLLQGRYCHGCGQKRIEPDELRIGWFMAQLVKALTMADGRFLGSIGRLLFLPGTLERDWLAGKRKRHLAPLSLFLIANLVYFFHPPLTDLNLSLAEQVEQQPYSAMAERMVAARLESRDQDFETYAAHYQAEATAIAKLLVILHAPLLALMLMLLHWRRRLFFVDHLAVSLHFWAFLLFMVMLVPWALALLMRIAGIGSHGLMQATLMTLVSIYAWQQLRVAYVQPAWMALAKLPVFILGFILAHMVYRAAQFLVAYALS
jgi:hypothetical protein